MRVTLEGVNAAGNHRVRLRLPVRAHEATGPNSANNGLPGTATPPQQPPFWRVTHRGGVPIVRVTLDRNNFV